MKKRLFIPPVIADCVYFAISGVSNVHFLQTSGCPNCSGILVTHDLKKRRFSTLRTENGEVQIFVYVKRFYCRDCGQLCYADAPFYTESRFGSPVVDLCLTFCREYSFSYTATLLDQMGVIIDRGTIRKMAQSHTHQIPVVDLYGIQLPESIMALSSLVMESPQSKQISGPDVLKACGFSPP